MDKNKSVEINGRKYDATTGLLISENNKANPKSTITRSAGASSSIIHNQLKKSHTLNRRALKNPRPTPKPQTKGQVMDIARSKPKQYASHPVKTSPDDSVIKKPKHPIAKTNPKHHPLTAQVKLKSLVAGTASQPLSENNQKNTKKSSKKPKVKKFSFGFLVVVALIVVVSLAYYFIPELSLKVASMQSGIDASYPSYTPADFRSNGPVSTANGVVTINFIGNQNQSYNITQEKSSWDSSALLTNVVKPAAGQSYITNQYSGITIYSYNNTSTWVNAGKIYKINSSSPLKSEDIRRIAISM